MLESMISTECIECPAVEAGTAAIQSTECIECPAGTAAIKAVENADLLGQLSSVEDIESIASDMRSN
eukprot:COSAG02_NODE_399_length_23112_cov_1107.712349_19_plen_67_part_00